MSYFLKPVKEKLVKKKLYGFDVETYSRKNKFLMGSLVRDDEVHVFWSLDEMREFILHSSKLKNARVFATNLGFDFLSLFGDDFELMSKFHYLIRGSDFINIKTLGNQNLNFSDTYSFFKASVKTLGNILNIPKLDKPVCLGQKVSKNTYRGAELERYNVNDSLISYKFAELLQDSFIDIGTNMKYTIASTSMSLFKNKYLKNWIKQPSRDDMIKMFEGYYGGRVEAFYRGFLDKTYYLYDINSLYPYVMQKYKYPDPNFMSYVKRDDKKVLKYEGLSHVSISNIPQMNIPLLPYRHDNKLLFPLGNFEGWHTHAELRKALSLGYEFTILQSYVYMKDFNPFREFVKDLYEKRMYYKKIKSPLQLIYKILLNSLYGKFAQKLEKTDIVFNITQEQKFEMKKIIDYNAKRQSEDKDIRFIIDTPDHNEYVNEQGITMTEPRLYYVKDLENQSYPKFINPILSIYITSYARLELYNYFEQIAKRNKKILYCDTDSLLTDNLFETSNKLGELKLECKATRGIIVKPKLYYVEDEEENKILCKTKGLKGFSGYKQFEKLLKTGKWKYEKFTKFKESIRRDLSFNEIITVEKFLDFTDNKRRWKSSSFNYRSFESSQPYVVADE